MPAQQAPQRQAKQSRANNSKKMANKSPTNQQGIPEYEIKQNSGAAASMALQATQKAWELRQAANAAGDPNAREEILAKAINKEIEAESFGKAAKYTRSGAFQGLAAGAGLGVQPGATLGKLTGALVGGVVSTVTGLLGGGVGSVYGAMNGPFWDLGEMASHGVRSIVGDFPNWKSTPAQKKALDKMVMQTRDTQAPTQEELEKMKNDAPDEMSPSWAQFTKDMMSWRPSMPSIPSIPKGATLGLGGLGTSMSSWGGQGKGQDQQQAPVQSNQRTQQPSQARPQQPKPSSTQPPKQEAQTARSARNPAGASKPKEGPKVEPTRSQKAAITTKPSNPPNLPKPRAPTTTTTSNHRDAVGDNKENRSPAAAKGERRKPRKLDSRSNTAKSGEASAPRKAPRKLESRRLAS